MENLEEMNFELVDLFGQMALFENCRVDRVSVPEGLFCYELRYADDDDRVPATMESSVVVNFFGTVICGCDFGLQEKNAYVAIGEEDFGFAGEEMNIDEFQEEFESSDEPLPEVLYCEQ